MTSNSTARRPRGLIKISGKPTIPLSMHVVSNSHFQCDTFSCTLAIYDDKAGFDLAFWGGIPAAAQAELSIGFLKDGDDVGQAPSQLQQLIFGQIDDVTVDLGQGTVSLSGRDFTALLIDNKVAKTYTDQTASQIVTDLVGQVGLTPQVTATKTPVGQYSKEQYSACKHDAPMWDWITALSEAEGFDAYVTGRTVYFGPPKADNSTPYSISFARDQMTGTQNLSVEDLQLKKALSLAKDITVTVLSYDRGKKAPIKAVAKRQGAAKSASTSFRQGSTSQNYTIRRAGMTQQQALQLAQKMLADLSLHERTFTATLPEDDGTLTSRSKVNISGTDTDWDQGYFIDTVTREFSFGQFSTSITAKNHQVESQPDA